MLHADFKKWLCHPVEFKKFSCHHVVVKEVPCPMSLPFLIHCRMLLRPRKGRVDFRGLHRSCDRSGRRG